MRTLLSILLGLVGMLAGAIISMVSAERDLGELVGISTREGEAYFQTFIAAPVGMVLGLAAGLLTASAITVKERRARKILPAGLAFIVLAGTFGATVRWSANTRPAVVRVKNETTAPLGGAYLGHDFRRATSLDTLEPGATTRDILVDLDEAGSFNGVHGGFRGEHKKLTLDEAQRASLVQGGNTLVITEVAGAVAIEARPDAQ